MIREISLSYALHDPGNICNPHLFRKYLFANLILINQSVNHELSGLGNSSGTPFTDIDIREIYTPLEHLLILRIDIDAEIYTMNYLKRLDDYIQLLELKYLFTYNLMLIGNTSDGAVVRFGNIDDSTIAISLKDFAPLRTNLNNETEEWAKADFVMN
ncbi:hypothetical protein D3C72_942360 [compost metagenome]